MGTTDKIRGLTNRTVGTIKRGLGRVTGRRGLQAEGLAQQIEGRTQTTIADARAGIRSVASRIGDGLR